MKQKRHTVDQMIGKLRRADVLLGKGTKVPEACKELGITEQTYYRWRQKYGGMQPEMAKELKTLEKENARLKKMVAEQALDMEILREAARGNGPAPNADGERLPTCVAVWGKTRYPSVERARCLASLAAHSVTSREAPVMKQGCFVKCGLWPGNAHALARIASTDFFSSVSGE